MKKIVLSGAMMFVAILCWAEVPITLYHAHPNFNFTEEMFAEHLDFLVDNDYHTVTLDEFMDWRLEGEPLPLRPIVLTFDDNYLDMRYIVYPLLKERDLNAVNFAHIIAINRPDNDDFRPDWPELIQWEEEGVLYTESHSWNHEHLTELSDDDAWFEINDSKIEIEQNMMPGKECKYLAYPYGDYDQQIIDKTESAGYVAAFTTINEKAHRDSPLYEMPRIGTDGVSLEGFKERIGFYDLPADPPAEGWALENEGPHFWYDDGFTSENGYMYCEPGDGSEEAGWKLYLPEEGEYRLHVRWPEVSQAASDTPFVIRHSEGESTLEMNQQQQSDDWVELDTFTFDAETALSVMVNNNADGWVVVGDLWIEPVDLTSVCDWQLYHY